MAIIKANYTKSNGNIKASIRYIQHRTGKDGQKVTRTLFGLDGSMERGEAYDIIDEAAEGINFFRFVISPDPKLEDKEKDLRLREITEKTMSGLEKRLGQNIQFIGAIHNDHAPHRHVHVIALISGRLTPQDFALLRQTATEESLFQRRERDAAQGIKQEQGVRQELELSL